MPFIDLYQRAAGEFGTTAGPVGMHSETQHGSMYVGSPETVAKRIARTVVSLDVGRFDLIFTSGAQPISARRKAVELYGSKVVPLVREILANGRRSSTAA